jgi:two-component system cell cycle response regulator
MMRAEELKRRILSAEEPVNTCDNVLIAEDDAMFRKILQSWLESWGYTVTVAADGDQAWNILQEKQAPQLLILDWMMPKLTGIDLCRMVRERHSVLYHYILLVTAKDEKQDLVAGLEAGADDYISKPFNRNELRARLRTGRRILTLQADQIEARAELQFQATHDSLTGVWNRRAVYDLLHREFEQATRTEKTLGIIMLDLDYFKKVNDTYGHSAGDSVLEQTARRIEEVIRSYDLLGRYGGEEFLIVLPDCDREEAEQCAERVRCAIAGKPIFTEAGAVWITTSLGTTIAEPRLHSVREALAAADLGLYKSKDEGRNRVSFHGLKSSSSTLLR